MLQKARESERDGLERLLQRM